MLLTNEVLASHTTPRPLYMLGGLVHNKHIIEAYQKEGIKVITSLEGITHGSIIITAHGATDAIKQDIINRGLTLIDATCQDVAKTHFLIKSKLQEGYQILFFGKKTHPETRGILGISPQIILIESEEDIEKLPVVAGPIAFMVQTTMSTLDLTKVLTTLRDKYPTIELHHDVCDATKQRQLALLQGINDADLVLIVGDPMSNNTLKLQEVAKRKTQAPVLLVESIDDLLDYDFTLIHKVVITAGASTPPAIVLEIEEGLKNGLHPSLLQSKDFLATQKPRN